MRALIFIAAILLSAPAFAQQPAPFVPYTIGPQEHQAFMNALGEIPAKYSLPLIQALAQLEQRAQQEAAKPPAEPEKKPE